MKDLTARKRLQSQAERLLREFRATHWVISPPNAAQINNINDCASRIEDAGKKQLSAIIDRIAAAISHLRTTYGLIAPPDQLLALLMVIESAPPGRNILVPLYIWRSLFRDGEHSFSGIAAWPIHARIALDATGRLYNESRHPVVYLLEAALFEDMAALFNEATFRHQRTPQAGAKGHLKIELALCRAASVAAVAFVECYLNGLATDYTLEHAATIDEQTKSLLLDWDFARQRSKYLSLRDKFLKYQTVILGVQHAPVQEFNCREMAIILDHAKAFRDAFAHPAPTTPLSPLDLQKEDAIANHDLSRTAPIVDAAIVVVRKLELTVHGTLGRLFWLHERGANGVFPEDVYD
jgi:hypothetical protein